MTDIDLSDYAAPRDGSQPLHGYLATPTGACPWPGVVMIHEIFGLDDVMRRHADRLAGLGYLTLAVDLFSSGSTVRCLASTMAAMVRGRGRAFNDIAAARDFLTASVDCTGKIGVVGFCMGGGFALLTANTGYGAAAVNYGMLPRDLDTALAGASHAFLNDAEAGPRLIQPLFRIAGIGPDPDAADNAWQRIECFFAATLAETDNSQPS
jgi:carboxymethylenebutenolidase